MTRKGLPDDTELDDKLQCSYSCVSRAGMTPQGALRRRDWDNKEGALASWRIHNLTLGTSMI
ncbi:hypothetical protein GOM44_01875 [Wolbachia endosymbiont of Atemnus politus]|uniref:hypothetical protein n=1 Tax=Wolbachia endosymbiont of Atemnus politus TaxID=2682840 RepID=UPI001572D77A|nr:hypothetical protein [Wolbachia endosymbiont of Atemnus politus]NSX83231.1 hypothetical protein [Wolbachia endosymbiont of Atemnus politus]